MEESTPEVKSAEEKPNKKKKKGFKYSDAFGGIIGSAIWLFIANNLVKWGFPILTDNWDQVLRVVNITATATIIAWVVLIILHIRPIFFTGKTLIDGLNIWGMWVTLSVFPFDFSVWPGWDWLDIVLQIVLWIGIIGTAIAIVIRTVRFLIGFKFN